MEIASRYDTDYMVLATANSIDNPDLIFPGDTLLVPCLPGQAPAAEGGVMEWPGMVGLP